MTFLPQLGRCRRTLLAGTMAALAAAAHADPAWAHAHLVRTAPSASVVAKRSPSTVTLTFSEPVEPRFSVVSVTDARRVEETKSTRPRTGTSPQTLTIPVRRLGEGWYLVFWRVVSADGHPTRGAFTFAVGPRPGPVPTFKVPSVSATVVTPGLIVTRSIVFLAMMAAVGLFALRTFVARPLLQREDLRSLTLAFAAACLVTLVATPIYVLLGTAQFALRSVFDLGAILPLVDVSPFGRDYLELELAFIVFAGAASLALAVERGDRLPSFRPRLVMTAVALGAAVFALVVPGRAGHAGQTSPRGLAVTFDAVHLAAGSTWLGGLLGLLVLWRSVPAVRRVAALVRLVPRFSNAAFLSVLALIGTGVGATILHLPTVASLWQTSYGKFIVAKAGLLATAVVLAVLNLLRERRASGQLLRGLVGVELGLTAGAVVAAALLSSIAPPPAAFAEAGHAAARIGPGTVHAVIHERGYRLDLHLTPNRIASPNHLSVRITRNGVPLHAAAVKANFAMLDMEMQPQSIALAEASPGMYQRTTPAFVMDGHWALTLAIAPRRRRPFDVTVVDHVTG